MNHFDKLDEFIKREGFEGGLEALEGCFVGLLAFFTDDVILDECMWPGWDGFAVTRREAE